MRRYWNLLKDVFTRFSSDDGMTLAGSLAFYAALSLAPLLLLALTLAGYVWSEEAAADELAQRFEGYLGEDGAMVVQQIIAQADNQQQAGWAAIIGIATLVIAATGVFAQLQYALNKIFNVRPDPERSGIRNLVRKRLLALVTILVIGGLLIASMVASTATAFITGAATVDLPGVDALWQALPIAISLALYTVAFAALFKVLPDIRIGGRVLWVGSLVTAILFLIGKELIGWYLGRGGVGSAYGVAGSLIALLLWVYYSAIVVFLGAEFTQAYAHHFARDIAPGKHAVPDPS